MSSEITISGLDIGEDARFLNDVTISDDNIKVRVENINVKGKLELLNDVEIDSVVSALRDRVPNMDHDSEEYKEINEIIHTAGHDKKNRREKMLRHLGNFSQGVLASILANLIMQ